MNNVRRGSKRSTQFVEICRGSYELISHIASNELTSRVIVDAAIREYVFALRHAQIRVVNQE